jgi:hypothetical protein
VFKTGLKACQAKNNSLASHIKHLKIRGKKGIKALEKRFEENLCKRMQAYRDYIVIGLSV